MTHVENPLPHGATKPDAITDADIKRAANTLWGRAIIQFASMLHVLKGTSVGTAILLNNAFPASKEHTPEDKPTSTQRT